MTRNANAHKKSGPPIAPGDDAPDNGAAAQQRVSIVSAAKAAPVTTSAPSSVFALGQAAKPAAKRGGMRPLLPDIDAATLVVQADVPKPQGKFSKSGDTKYAAIFDALKPGLSLPLPVAYRGAVYAAALKRAKAGQGKYTVRRVSDTQMRIWQDA
jgi:hypothetical protein